MCAEVEWVTTEMTLTAVAHSWTQCGWWKSAAEFEHLRMTFGFAGWQTLQSSAGTAR